MQWEQKRYESLWQDIALNRFERSRYQFFWFNWTKQVSSYNSLPPLFRVDRHKCSSLSIRMFQWIDKTIMSVLTHAGIIYSDISVMSAHTQRYLLRWRTSLEWKATIFLSSHCQIYFPKPKVNWKLFWALARGSCSFSLQCSATKGSEMC